jgi:DNA-binding response OmpR family regulator
MLLMEDNPVDTDLLQEMISLLDGFTVDMDWTETLARGLALLELNEYDILLLDLGLPDSTGLDTLRRTIQVTTEIPIIVLTGLDEEEVAVEALRIGAQDYLPKDRLNPDMLRRSIRYSLERKKSEQKFVEVFESAGQAVYVLNMEGKILVINRLAAQRLGYSRDELLGQTPLMIEPPEYTATLGDRMEALKSRGSLVFARSST